MAVLVHNVALFYSYISVIDMVDEMYRSKPLFLTIEILMIAAMPNLIRTHSAI